MAMLDASRSAPKGARGESRSPRRSVTTRASLPAAVARRAAKLLRARVAQRLRERPAMAERILGLVLALAVLEVGRLHEDLRAVGARVVAVGLRVVDPYDDRMGLLPRPRRSAVLADG